jgi:hypothetical protein
MMVVQTRKAKDPSIARPNREQRLENAALRSHVRKSIEKAQQEEAFKELIKARPAMEERPIMELLIK